MFTKHLIAVVLNNEYRVAQYCESIGQPSHAGSSIIEFLSQIDINYLRASITHTEFISDAEIILSQLKKNEKINEAEHHHLLNEFYLSCESLSKEMSYDVLDFIVNNQDGTIYLQNDLDFSTDMLCCYWGYVIDLDSDCLEIYVGQNKTPLDKNERFYDGMPDKYGYYPIRKIVSYPFNALPSIDDLHKLEKIYGMEDKDETIEASL